MKLPDKGQLKKWFWKLRLLKPFFNNLKITKILKKYIPIILSKIKTWIFNHKKIAITVAVLCLLHISYMIHVIYVRNNVDILNGIEFSASYQDKNGELLQVFLTSDDKYRIYKPVTDYPPEFLEALLLQEDKYFYSHKGINPVAIIKAGWETYIKKTRRIGASTITMQTAKLKYNIYTKSIWGKLKQITKALYLERCYSKQEILEAYVNLVPCGGNVEGFETASWFYFSKSIKQLNLSENIMLCVLPQNPIKRAPTPTKTPSELIDARKVLFNTWVHEHPEDLDKEIFMDMQMNVNCYFPNRARHFTEMLALQKNISSRSPIRTTLDIKLQNVCEELFDTYINQNRSFGVNNGAVLLVDWTTMDIVANIGSANYYDNSIEGQVNATTSKRSPGSTLKPFIYAMALEQGLIHYKTMLKDTPITFNEYSPDNYGSIFKGPVQAWFALADSRNIPAIYLNQNLHERDLYDFMKDSDVSLMKEKEHYGLSIVLGSCEVTMLELAKMYCTLANEGIQKEINYTEHFNIQTGKRLLTKESSFIVRKMLEDNVPPYQIKPKGVENVPVAYKTGTSIGFKDSWSAAIFDRYVIIVWIGNFDGQGNNSFLGRAMAAPLLFNIAYNIISNTPQEKLLPPQEVPDTVIQIPVCSVSGGLPCDDCLQTEPAWFIPGISPIDKCKIHRRINVDTRTGYRTDDSDKPYIKSVVREFWPSDLQALFEQAGLPRLKPPEYPPQNYNIASDSKGFPPEIISPMTGTDYIFRTKDISKNKILLHAVGDADTGELLWFDGSNFLGRTLKGKTLEWRPKPGRYQITVTDDKGRSDWVDVNIIETEY